MTLKEINELLVKELGEGGKIIEPVTGGMMNVSYLCENASHKKYILYVSTEQANEMVDRALEKEHQEIVARLGLTSQNVYFDVDKGIKINEYIEGLSLDKVDEYDHDKVAKLLKQLHRSIIISRSDYAPFRRFLEEYEKEALTYQKEISPLYSEIREFLFERRYYLESQEKVLCHNDAQKSNIVKSVANDYYLIDFEFMGNNDPIYDIATFGNASVKEGRTLLDHYCFGNASYDKVKRYYLWRMFISLQWYNVAITKHYRGEGEKHNFNFLKVAEHFLNNAKDAYEGYKMEIKEKEVNDDTVRLIIETLDKVRHFLQKDGGDCQFVSFQDGIVYVKMYGACDGCAYAGNDIKELVEVILQEEVPGVLEVRVAL